MLTLPSGGRRIFAVPIFQFHGVGEYDQIRMSIGSFIIAACMFIRAVGGVGQTPSPSAVSVQQHMLNAQEDMRARNPDLAIGEYQAVVAAEPSNMDAQANLGVLLYFGKQYEQSIPHLRAALSAKPDLWKLRALLGLAESHLAKDTAAEADLEAALPHLQGEKVQAEVGDTLVDRYAAEGELEKAAATVSVLLESDPANLRLLLMDYRLHSDLASRALLSLALAGPKSAEMHAAMARELGRQGNEAAAVENYRAALALQPDMPGLAFEFGTVLYRSTDDKLRSEAEAEFKTAVAQNPRDEKAELLLGEIAATRGDNRGAFDHDSRAVALQPDDADACVELSKVLISMKQADKARELLLHAIAVDPTNATAHYRLSTLDRQQGHPEAAKKELAEYQKYKEIKDKLREVFQTMRVPLEKPEDANGASR